MKQILVFLFLIPFCLFSQSTTPVSTPNPAKESETKTPAKAGETKTAEAKTTDSKTVPAKVEPAPKKELPPLQKEGGFLVLHGVKWQAENITKKAYIVAKEECEKNGMRLPTRDELVDAYYSKYPEFRTPAGHYMSGNRRASDRSNIWYVSFDNGHHNSGSLFREYNVRCVKVEAKETKDAPAPAKTDTPADSKK
ncbi:MAG: DUF1566 domain-containing protein [Leptospiraceae bacterium]|nr:DUF1566 domain-containing protein [Leptospiraceae bacterium]